MRTVLVTGPGGAGRTTTAAATALAAARQGRRVLLLTSDRGPAPEAVLGVALPAPPVRDDESPAPWAPPVEVAPGLRAARIAVGEHFRDRARELQDRGASLFDLLGATPLDAEELTELPGAEPLAILTALRAAHTGDAPWDLLVVDMPPAPETIRLLALPEQLRRYLRRLLPPERQAARALRPMLAQLAGVPMPAQRLYETAERWEAELAAVQRVIEARSTTVRLVVEPGPVAVEAVRVARAGLALQSCRIDTLVTNRLFPDAAEAPGGTAGSWLAGLVDEQRTALKALREEFLVDAVTVCELPHLGRGPRGAGDLAELAGRARSTAVGGTGIVEGDGLTDELDGWTGPDPDGAGSAEEPDAWSVEDRIATDGVLVWRLPLPGADRDGLDLVRRGDELIVGVGPFRRVLPLPSALRRCTVSGAALRDGALCVRFTPDPGLWPRTS
ncbi:ArsA-related P-loop ATPase [Streptomyces syringium]|uniref:ArsA family ATPase n=1 Tax=Streptomyces syringium TaxID=76729 RepID=UPI003449D83A